MIWWFPISVHAARNAGFMWLEASLEIVRSAGRMQGMSVSDEQVKKDLRTIKQIVSGARQLADLAESVGMTEDAKQLRVFAQRREPIVREAEEDKKQSAEIIIFPKATKEK